MKINGKVISKEEEKILRQIMHSLFTPRDIDEKYATLDGKLIFENNRTGESIKFCGKDGKYYRFIERFYSCRGDKYGEFDYLVKIENGCAYTYKNGIINSLVVCLNKTENGNLYIKNGTKVIYNFAFKNCKFNNVIVPDSVGFISKNEFFPSSIKKITLKSKETKIYNKEDKRFNKIINFEENELKSLIKEDGSLVVPNNITKILGYAFGGCTSLKSIVIPDSVTSIGEYAFYNCTSLKNIVIPSSVKSIGKYAFEGCTSLTKVNYTGTIDQWVETEFYDDRSYPLYHGYSNPLCYAKNLYINNELTTNIVLTTATKINNDAFCNCTSITSVALGEHITCIGMRAFENCTSLISVVLPNNLKTIGWRAFNGCHLLKGKFDDMDYYVE